MPYSVNIEAGERVILKQDIYEKMLGEPFLIAVSHRALYFPHKKRFAVSDPYVTQRLLLSDIQEIGVRRVSSLGPLLIAVSVLLLGLFTVVDDVRQGHIPMGGVKLAAMAGFLIIGLIGRKALVVKTVQGRHVWRIPSSMKQSGREVLDAVFTRILGACREAGIRVSE